MNLTPETLEEKSPETIFPIAELIARAQEGMGLDDKAIADALGYESPKVIEMIRAGTMRLPLNKAHALAQVLEMEPRQVLHQLLRESAPDLLRTIEVCMGPLLLSPAESRLINRLREMSGGRPITPMVMDGPSVVAVVVSG